MNREEAIGKLRGLVSSCPLKHDEWQAIEVAIKALKEQRPHGEWIFTGRHNAYGGAEIECSNCHTKLMVSMSRWEIGENFCDVCGSRNKKEGDRND